MVLFWDKKISRKDAKEVQRHKDEIALGAFASSLRLCVKPSS